MPPEGTERKPVWVTEGGQTHQEKLNELPAPGGQPPLGRASKVPAAFAAQHLPYRNPIFSGLGFAGSPGWPVCQTHHTSESELDIRLSPTGIQS